MYDLLIIGSGFYGSVIAHEAKKQGKSVLVIEKRSHIGGNCYTKETAKIQQHFYGPHLFNTNNKKIWNYVNQFANFEQYTHRTKVNYKGKLYSFPINLFTLYQLWGCTTPEEAKKLLEEKRVPIATPKNLEELIISQLGVEIFEIFYQGYSEKQWQTSCKNIPCEIGKRIPIRMTFDDRYHDTKYCGMPANGDYTAIFNQLLDGIEVQVNTDFYSLKSNWRTIAKKLIYTGAIDELFDYQFGELEYRSLKFETHVLDTDNFQGTANVNYTDRDVPYTRITEHKWFSPKKTKQTVITYEYPDNWQTGKERYYPINNKKNTQLYNKYLNLMPNDIIGGGRMFLYKYIDMDETVARALKDVKKL